MAHDEVRPEHETLDEAVEAEASPGVGTDGSLHTEHHHRPPTGVGTDGSLHTDHLRPDEDADTST